MGDRRGELHRLKSRHPPKRRPSFGIGIAVSRSRKESPSVPSLGNGLGRLATYRYMPSAWPLSVPIALNYRDIDPANATYTAHRS